MIYELRGESASRIEVSQELRFLLSLVKELENPRLSEDHQRTNSALALSEEKWKSIKLSSYRLDLREL